MGGITCNCHNVEQEIINSTSQIDKRESNSQKSLRQQEQTMNDRAISSTDYATPTQLSINPQARCLSPTHRNQLSPINIKINKFDMDFEEEPITDSLKSHKQDENSEKSEIPENKVEQQLELSNNDIIGLEKQKQGKANKSLFYQQQDQKQQSSNNSSGSLRQIRVFHNRAYAQQNEQSDKSSSFKEESLQISKLGQQKLKKARINDKKISRSLSIKKNMDKGSSADEVREDEQSMCSKRTIKGILKQNSLHRNQASMSKDALKDNMSIGTKTSKKSVRFDEKSIRRKIRNTLF